MARAKVAREDRPISSSARATLRTPDGQTAASTRLSACSPCSSPPIWRRSSRRCGSWSAPAGYAHARNCAREPHPV